MPKQRNKENLGLPSRWQLMHGAYYYQVPRGLEHRWDGKKKFRLGGTISEAYATWASRIKDSAAVTTVGQLLDRYAMEVIPTKAAATQSTDIHQVILLRKVFGDMPISAITPQVVYKFFDERSKKEKSENGRIYGGISAAHKGIEVLSHAFTRAVRWGYIAKHPFKNELELENPLPRTRYVEDWEVIECLQLYIRRRNSRLASVQAYIRLKLLTSLRRADLLCLEMANLREDGIHVTPRKTSRTTAKSVIYEWTDELRLAVEMAKSARPRSDSKWLFCDRYGKCYFNFETGNAAGWNSIWQRFMKRVLSETKVKERFTAHDLRAKCASDAETLAHAVALLVSADSKTAKRFYRRKPERVSPLR